jgi:hypothetical protein
MNFRVLYRPEAGRRPTEAWLNHSTARAAITAASDLIDRLLASDPENAGESRPNGRRIPLSAPLGVLFRVDPVAREVWVTTVWYFE